MNINTPDWAKHAIFYQIFPDRFARSGRTPHPPGLQLVPWGSPPDEQGFQGGDLLGVVDKLDYLTELGINALYLTPVFSSASNHRYHTYDYFEVDPLLGGNTALRELLDAAHARDMRVVLDGVFNHTGRGFWQFHHILENGDKSPYLDWFKIQRWPLNPYPTRPRQQPHYEAWWNLPALPKLNTSTPAVREFLFEVARHWIDFGTDGWRLDVPSEIDDDEFWRTFRRVVKETNPEAYLCGEIWRDARRWLQGDQFDAVMNYLFTGPVISFFAADTYRNDYAHPSLPFAPIEAHQLAQRIEEMYALYDWEINFAQMNMLDSHDMARLAWIVQDPAAMRLCVLFQMTMPGAPCIYYGDEVGLSGGDDPYCRAAFPWHDEQQWDRDLLDFYRRVIALRKGHRVFRVGKYETLLAEGRVIGFRRSLDDSEAVVVLNASTTLKRQKLHRQGPAWTGFKQLWPHNFNAEPTAADNTLEVTLPAQDAVVLLQE